MSAMLQLPPESCSSPEADSLVFLYRKNEDCEISVQLDWKRSERPTPSSVHSECRDDLRLGEHRGCIVPYGR